MFYSLHGVETFQGYHFVLKLKGIEKADELPTTDPMQMFGIIQKFKMSI